MKPMTSKKIFYIWLLLVAFAFTFCSILLKVFSFQVVGLIFQACVLIITLSSLVLNCHSKRRLREQAAADAEAAIAAQINRAFEKEAAVKADPPPEYELPPTYIEAIKRLEKEDFESLESELDKSLSSMVIRISTKFSKTDHAARSDDSKAESMKSTSEPEISRTDETQSNK